MEERAQQKNYSKSRCLGMFLNYWRMQEARRTAGRMSTHLPREGSVQTEAHDSAHSPRPARHLMATTRRLLDASP